MSFLCKEKKRKMTFKYKCQASCLSTGICCDSHLVSMFCRMFSIISSTQNKCLSHLYFFLFSLCTGGLQWLPICCLKDLLGLYILVKGKTDKN